MGESDGGGWWGAGGRRVGMSLCGHRVVSGSFATAGFRVEETAAVWMVIRGGVGRGGGTSNAEIWGCKVSADHQYDLYAHANS